MEKYLKHHSIRIQGTTPETVAFVEDLWAKPFASWAPEAETIQFTEYLTSKAITVEFVPGAAGAQVNIHVLYRGQVVNPVNIDCL